LSWFLPYLQQKLSNYRALVGSIVGWKTRSKELCFLLRLRKVRLIADWNWRKLCKSYAESLKQHHSLYGPSVSWWDRPGYQSSGRPLAIMGCVHHQCKIHIFRLMRGGLGVQCRCLFRFKSWDSSKCRQKEVWAIFPGNQVLQSLRCIWCTVFEWYWFHTHRYWWWSTTWEFTYPTHW
jgi:hypothetical protein